jgi:pimeloyl-ACP methyl ester carboxylesterase
VEPFRIHVADRVLDDLRERLSRTRWPDTIPGSGWDYGTDTDYLRELCDYWRDGYDWRAAEAALNGFDQIRTDVDGLGMHCIHQRSPHEHALPLMLTHGWPDTVYLFHRIIGPLTRPEDYGGDQADAFHVVCPSVPGYGWSEAPTEPGWHVRRIAEAQAALMRGLGYERYGVQGGDWGALISPWIALSDPGRVCGVHLNMVPASPPRDREPTEEDLAALKRGRAHQRSGMGYAMIQGTRPQTLGVGLNDSPAGLAGWIVEKYREWSDCGGDVESVFPRDVLLSSITAYWATGTITSSVRLYFESMRAGLFGPPTAFVETPVAAAVFPREIFTPPRSWAEQHYHIVRWTEFPSGGHFAALERPEELVADIRAFFRELR